MKKCIVIKAKNSNWAIVFQDISTQQLFQLVSIITENINSAKDDDNILEKIKNNLISLNITDFETANLFAEIT